VLGYFIIFVFLYCFKQFTIHFAVAVHLNPYLHLFIYFTQHVAAYGIDIIIYIHIYIFSFS